MLTRIVFVPHNNQALRNWGERDGNKCCLLHIATLCLLHLHTYSCFITVTQSIQWNIYTATKIRRPSWICVHYITACLLLSESYIDSLLGNTISLFDRLVTYAVLCAMRVQHWCNRFSLFTSVCLPLLLLFACDIVCLSVYLHPAYIHTRTTYAHSLASSRWTHFS